jgi:hypothetical protein
MTKFLSIEMKDPILAFAVSARSRISVNKGLDEAVDLLEIVADIVIDMLNLVLFHYA